MQWGQLILSLRQKCQKYNLDNLVHGVYAKFNLVVHTIQLFGVVSANVKYIG